MSVRNNLLYNIINNIVAVIFPVITIPYISRVLGVENIGIIGFATSYSGYFTLFAGLGISIYGSREIAKLKNDKEKRSKLFSELFFLMLISSLICTTIYLIPIFTVSALQQQKYFLLVSGITLYLNAFSLDWFFSGRENFKMITIRSVIIKLLCILLMFVFVKSKNNALLYCGIVALSSVLSNIWNFNYILKNEIYINFNSLSLGRHLKPLLILLSTNLAISIYTTLDTLMLGFLSNFIEVGYYSSAIKVSRILLPFAVATTSVMVPKISYAYSTNDKQQYIHYLQKSFSLVSFFACPMAIGLFIVTPYFVPFFFGTEFLGVIPVLQLNSSILLFVGLSNYFGIQVLATSGYESKLLISILLGAIVNFILNMIFIPRYGAVAAATNSALCELIIFITTFIMTLKFTDVRVNWTPLFHSILSSLPMILFYFVLPIKFGTYNLATLVLTGFFSYFICQSLVFKNKVAFEIINKFTNLSKQFTKWI